jgi:hypothetical protein
MEDLDLDNGEYNKNSYLIGVKFIEPVDDYLIVERAIKFGALFIILTFLSLILSDLGSSRLARRKSPELHPLQYAMVGLALVLFYLITLTLSEHLGFGPAYFIASLTTVLMIGGYALSATNSRQRSLIVTALTALLYGVLYLILRQEDYALLSGTTLLVAVLITLMFLTRKVNRPEPLEGPFPDDHNGQPHQNNPGLKPPEGPPEATTAGPPEGPPDGPSPEANNGQPQQNIPGLSEKWDYPTKAPDPGPEKP